MIMTTTTKYACPLIYVVSQLLLSARADNDNVETEEEIRVEDWFNIIRFQVALAIVIFGCHLILYSDVAMWLFLKQYKDTELKQDIEGTVLSCVEAKGYHKKYEIILMYSSMEPINDKASSKKKLVPKEFIVKSLTDWKTPRGTKVKLNCIKSYPRSACTSDIIEKELERLQSLLLSRGMVVLLPAILLLGLFVTMSVIDISKFNSAKTHAIGFSLLASIMVGATMFSSWMCHQNFIRERQHTYLSAIPINQAKEIDIRNSDSKQEPLIDPESNTPVIPRQKVVIQC